MQTIFLSPVCVEVIRHEKKTEARLREPEGARRGNSRNLLFAFYMSVSRAKVDCSYVTLFYQDLSSFFAGYVVKVDRTAVRISQ